MEERAWKQRRFSRHEVVEGINEAEHICVPGMQIFRQDRLSSWLDETITALPGNQSLNLSLLLSKFPYWFCESDGTYALQKQFETKGDVRGPRRPVHDYSKEFLTAIARLSSAIPSGYDRLFARHYSIPDGIRLHHLDMTTITRLLIGHAGVASVLEMGITLHPYYGFPVIPGSAIKGVTRHFCAEMMSDKRDEWEPMFGNEPASRTPHEGEVVFYDAWPVIEKPGRSLLELDNITTHYPDYYRRYQQATPSGGTGQALTPKSTGSPVYPSDDDNPIPHFFLAVSRGVNFRFAVRPSASTGRQGLAPAALKHISDALIALGIGAKTGSGYGYFRRTA